MTERRSAMSSFRSWANRARCGAHLPVRVGSLCKARQPARVRLRWCIGPSTVLAIACVGLTACSGPIDLTVVNPCSVDIHVQTYDGELDRTGRWVPDAEPVADFVVPAGETKKQKGALMFVTAPEEIRLVAPVEQSFLISITDDLDDGDRWTIPLTVCHATDT